MPTEPTPERPSDTPSRDLAAYFGTVTLRTGEATASTTLEVRDDLRDAQGDLRIGAVTYAVDVATGLSMGLAVLDRDLWVVTTDLDVHVTAPVTGGRLRIDVEVVRAGATTAVSTFTLHDEDTDRCVGGGTATGRPFPFEFDTAWLQVPIGRALDHGLRWSGPRQPVLNELGARVGEDGSVELDVEDWLKNPWGILHGGVTACLIDVAGEVAASAALGRPSRSIGELVRYLAPGRVGPVHAHPRLLAVDEDRAIVEVRVVDAGADDRLMAVGTVTVA